MIGSYLEALTSNVDGGNAKRSTQADSDPIEVEVTPKKSAMKAAKKQAQTDGDGQEVIIEHQVTEQDFKKGQ